MKKFLSLVCSGVLMMYNTGYPMENTIAGFFDDAELVDIIDVNNQAQPIAHERPATPPVQLLVGQAIKSFPTPPPSPQRQRPPAIQAIQIDIPLIPPSPKTLHQPSSRLSMPFGLRTTPPPSPKKASRPATPNEHKETLDKLSSIPPEQKHTGHIELVAARRRSQPHLGPVCHTSYQAEKVSAAPSVSSLYSQQEEPSRLSFWEYIFCKCCNQSRSR